MITEEHVSFEVAKLLKEKEFECAKGSITAMYNENGIFHSLCTSEPNGYYYDYDDFDEHDYIAPTLQMAMKWLREVHRLSIELFVDYGSDDESWWSVDVSKIKKGGFIDTLTGYSSYEQACEAGIKYCLENLI